MVNLADAVKYHYGEFPPKNLDTAKFLTPLVEAAEAIGRYDQMLKNLHNSEILLAPLRNQEAVISSRMEGTVSTIDEILMYEADHKDETAEYIDDVRSEIIETVLYQRALKAAQQAVTDGYPFSQSLVKTMHQRLLSYGRGASKNPGAYKTEQNYLTGYNKQDVKFIPVSAEKLNEGMDALFDYIENSQDMALVKTAIAHIEFEALHPFKDGNGRIGRMLMTLMLWTHGVISAPHFYVSGYFEEHKAEYIDAMRNVSRSGDWESWCAFCLTGMKEQAINNLRISEQIKSLYEIMKEQFTEILSSKWNIQVLDYVFTNPVFKSTSLAKETGISNQNAARYARLLCDAGLMKITVPASGRRPAKYSFEPLLEIVRV